MYVGGKNDDELRSAYVTRVDDLVSSRDVSHGVRWQTRGISKMYEYQVSMYHFYKESL